jgi:hypothetical protein
MNDAIALLAISQLVCLAAMVYLYSQVQALRRDRPARRTISPRAQTTLKRPMDMTGTKTANRAAHNAYAASRPAPAVARPESADIAARMSELGMDIPALARRMQKSEEEVRLLLRRNASSRREMAS